MLRQSRHFLTHALILHRAATRQPSREEALLSRKQQQIAVRLHVLLCEDGRARGCGLEGEWVVGDEVVAGSHSVNYAGGARKEAEEALE